jgi:hypothetical protein
MPLRARLRASAPADASTSYDVTGFASRWHVVQALQELVGRTSRDYAEALPAARLRMIIRACSARSHPVHKQVIQIACDARASHVARRRTGAHVPHLPRFRGC